MRRKSKRIWFVALGVFVAVFLFSFLIQKYKNTKEAEAASLAKFDPGYIISDYQMGNYNSMNEADIQGFLTAKNPCSNTNYNYYKTLSANKNYKWHFKDGHFVCLSEERFGDGEVIGSGQSAAHIIYKAAQDYKINPQVIIVLLQKETSLITDPIPNNGDYRKAAGYGCPDTAACSSKYYGFKNQVRNAAKMFRTVLDGGWTNYPLGKNYVQYNPNKACGGSIVNIRSLATSALYRYTPYQPNAGALAAGYGTASCGAYGNRNFYLYFQDWFGGITSSSTINDRYKKLGGADGYLGKSTNEEKCGLINGGCYRKYQNGSIYWSEATGSWDVHGGIYDAWVKTGAEKSGFGYPKSAERKDIYGKTYQEFERGRIYWIKDKTQKIYGGIYGAWSKTGAEKSAVSYPKSTEKKNTKGATYQEFEKGRVYWTSKDGGFVVSDWGVDRYEKIGSVKSAIGAGKSVPVCGLRNSGCYQAFKNGFLYWTKNTGTWEVHGGIRDVWSKYGSEKSIGYPKSTEKKNTKGATYQEFEKGRVYWTSKDGGFVVSDWGVDRYEKIGSVKSAIGAGKSVPVCGLRNSGCYQAFKNGFLYWTKNTGTWEVHGGIYDAWKRAGLENGVLGYPKSEEKKNSSNVTYQEFEKGKIYWTKKRGAWVSR